MYKKAQNYLVLRDKSGMQCCLSLDFDKDKKFENVGEFVRGNEYQSALIYYKDEAVVNHVIDKIMRLSKIKEIYFVPFNEFTFFTCMECIGITKKIKQFVEDKYKNICKDVYYQLRENLNIINNPDKVKFDVGILVDRNKENSIIALADTLLIDINGNVEVKNDLELEIVKELINNESVYDLYLTNFVDLYMVVKLDNVKNVYILEDFIKDSVACFSEVFSVYKNTFEGKSNIKIHLI